MHELPNYARTASGNAALHRRAANLIALRERHALTLTEMASRLGLRAGHLSTIERAMRPLTLRHVDAIARAFRMTPAEVLAMLDAEVTP